VSLETILIVILLILFIMFLVGAVRR